MSEYVYTDKKSNVTESQWKKWENQEKLGYLESLIGYKIYNGENLSYSWDGCPVSKTAGILDPSGNPYIVIDKCLVSWIKFKATGSTSTNAQTVYPQSYDLTCFELTSRLYWGEVSFATDTKNLYQWNDGEQQVDELNTGFGFVLDNNATTKKIGSDIADIYLINTQKFKIRNKNISVYGTTGAKQIDSGNYTYDYDFNYGYAIGRNYYAWGKNQVKVIPLWTNEFDGEIDESNGIVVNDQEILIYFKGQDKPQTYDRPKNSKVVICKRTVSNIDWNGMYLGHSSLINSRPYYKCVSEVGSIFNRTEASLFLRTKDMQVPSGDLSFPQSYLLSTDGKTYMSHQSPEKWNKDLGFKNADFEQSNYIPGCDQTENLWTETTNDLAEIQIKENTTKYSFKTTGLYRSFLFKSPDSSFTTKISDPIIIAKKSFAYVDIHSVTEVDASGILSKFLYEESWLSSKNEKGVLEYNGEKYPYYDIDKSPGQAAVYASTQIKVARPYPCYWVFIVSEDFEVVP